MVVYDAVAKRAREKMCQKKQNDDKSSSKDMGTYLDLGGFLEPEMTPSTDSINQVGPEAREKEKSN